jgi:hypothetical protein
VNDEMISLMIERSQRRKIGLIAIGVGATAFWAYVAYWIISLIYSIILGSILLP